MRGFSDALLIAVSFFLLAPLASASAQIDPDAGDEMTGARSMAGARIISRTLDPDAGDEAAAAYPCGATEPSDPDCVPFGVFLNRDSRTYVYRGNVYNFNRPAVLKEIKMELAFATTVTAELRVAIHQKQPNGDYKRYVPDVVIPGAEGCGTNPLVSHFYSTADAEQPMTPVTIEAGFDYAIAFAWEDKSITHGYGGPGYLVPFRAGQVLGLVHTTASQPPDPLVPDTFVYPRPGFYGGVYSMQLCFEPQPGACCSQGAFVGRPDCASADCCEVLQDFCTGAGSFFHGEYTRCADTPCIFGTCCDPCDGCHDPYTPEACDLGRPDRQWTAFDCPTADPELLCPIITGACCRGTTCTQECRHNCENPPPPTAPGTYRGDGTDCTPNECPGAVGACCVTGGCLNYTQASCTSHPGTYRGPGTRCLTLEDECGGACCRGFAFDYFVSCGHVASRAECAPDPKGGGFPYNSYRGDGTICPDLTPNPNDSCDDLTEVACCLPDGTCINMTDFYCRASWVKGEPHPGDVCEDQPTLCPSSLRRCCFLDGSCDLLTPTGCLAFGGASSATDTTCPVNACPSSTPTGACCGNNRDECVVTTEAQCDAQGGQYQCDGTDCATPDICPGFGACCFSNGDCLDDVSLDQCNTLGGEYQNDKSLCDAIDCDERGACCAITGTCLFITGSQCTGIGGEFKGNGVSCTANTCPAGACCLTGGCEIRTEVGCTPAGGGFQGVDVPCAADTCRTAACCFDDNCEMRTEALCVAPKGAFAGQGIACDPGRCLTGVCCSTLGECTALRSHECHDAGGDFAGVSTTCSADSCARGACCLSTGCEISTSARCAFSGGVFLGDNSVCDVDVCTLGACCDGIACSSDIRFSCVGGGHVFKGPGTTCDSPNICPCTSDPQCDDGSDCTDDSCDPTAGCMHLNNTAPCDDGDACTTNDTCSAGACVGGPTLDCDDGDDCTNDRCENGLCVNDEFAALVLCLGGPDLPIPPGCACFDLNADNHVDLRDVSLFFLAFEAP